MKINISKSVIQEVRRRIQSKKNTRGYIQEELSVSAEVAAKVAQVLRNNHWVSQLTISDKGISTRVSGGYEKFLERFETPITEPTSTIVNTPGYTYNAKNDTYIVPLKCTGKPLVLKRWQHEAILADYSNFDRNPQTVDEICNKFGLTRKMFLEYQRKMGFTHTSLPLTDEDIAEKDNAFLVDELLTKKKFALIQEFNKKDWKQTQEAATKWEEFENGVINPFEQLLNKFTPPKLPKVKLSRKATGDKTLLVGLSDLHFGSIADRDELVHKNDNNTQITALKMANYSGQIADKLATHPEIKTIEVCVLGDILHGINGKTKKGTQLDFDVIGERQFDAALISCISFIHNLLALVEVVNVRVVKGNHAGIDEYMLFRAVEAFFADDERVSFDIAKSRAMLFEVKNTLVVMDHGDSDFIKAKVPTQSIQRRNYVQSLLLNNPEKLQGKKSKIFLQGDMHHYEQQEFADFEFFMFGTITGGDKYSDHLNLKARPRQNALLLDDDGVSEVWHLYFD